MTTATNDTICKPMPAEIYHADKTAWGKSMLMDFRSRRSVCYARHVLGTAPAFKRTRKMDIGDVAHVALLEPHKLKTHYVTFPQNILAKNGAVSTNAAEAFKAEHEAAGKVVLKDSEFAVVKSIVESVSSHKHVGKWLSVPAKIEHAMYWTDDTTGLRCKCRPDFMVIQPELSVVLDLKTTGDVCPGEFRKRVEDMGYWLQASHYSAGVRAVFGVDPRFLFVAVETEWPYACAVYELSEYDRGCADDVRSQLLCDVATCFETGDWSDDWANTITTLNLKKYVYSQ